MDRATKPRTERVEFWVGLVLATSLVVAVCVLAARWQWGRYEARQAEIHRITANYDSTPVPLADLVPPGGALADDDVWRTASASGQYVPGSQVVLRNRKVDGAAAFHLLAVLATDDDRLLVVDRGWVEPDADQEVPPDLPSPPTGPVDVVVHLRLDERPSTRGAPPGQVQAVNGQQVLTAGGLPESAAANLVDAYGILIAENPDGTAGLATYPPPDLDPRNHLSYTFQWYLFAAGAVLWAVLHARREWQADHGTAQPKQRRRGVDEEYEDSLLD